MNNYTMNAPASSGSTRKNVELLQTGIYPGVLFGMVDMGTTKNIFGNKSRRIKLFFELPNQKALFYEDDTELKPRVLNTTYTFSLSKNREGKKSNLLQLVEKLYGPIPDNQYNTFNVAQMLGNTFNLSIIVKTKKDNSSSYNTIDNINPFQNFWPNDDLQRTNDIMFFSLSQGFESANFANLYNWLRTEIMNSDEGLEHAARGGKFAKYDDNKNLILESAGVPVQQNAPNFTPNVAQPNPIPAQPQAQVQSPQVQQKLVMIDTQHTYEAYKSAGWTDEALVQQGLARYEQIQVQAPTPMPTPVPAPAPVNAQPVSPQPMNPQPVNNQAVQNVQAPHTSTGTGTQPINPVDMFNQGVPQPVNSSKEDGLPF